MSYIHEHLGTSYPYRHLKAIKKFWTIHKYRANYLQTFRAKVVLTHQKNEAMNTHDNLDCVISMAIFVLISQDFAFDLENLN